MGAVAYSLTPGVSGSASRIVTLFHGPAPPLYTIVLLEAFEVEM